MASPHSFLTEFALSPVIRVTTLGEQTHWITYIGAAICAGLCYLGLRVNKRTSVRGLINYILPKKLLRHPSTKLDLKLFLLGCFYFTLQGTIIISSKTTGLFLQNILQRFFGAPVSNHNLNIMIALALPVVMFLALELGYWIAHYMMHRIRWLWEFHKVHHSAEIMTPLTEWRQHPVELLIFPLCMNLTVGIASAPLLWIAGTEAHMFKFWHFGIILFLMSCTLVHLRHTHIKVGTYGWLGHILQSPAHHHIHHSTQKRHFDKNLGFCLSVWDWAFGTLYLPEKNQKITFGLGEPDHELQTLKGSLVAPIRRGWRSDRDN